MKKYLVTTDGSDHSRKALSVAKEFATCSGADIVLIHVLKDNVIDPSSTMLHESLLSAAEIKKLEKPSQMLLEDSLKLFEDFPRQVETILAKGNPAEEIIREAEKGSYDLIVMGSRGLGTFSRAMLGSISNKVLNHAKINVLIVK